MCYINAGSRPQKGCIITLSVFMFDTQIIYRIYSVLLTDIWIEVSKLLNFQSPTNIDWNCQLVFCSCCRLVVLRFQSCVWGGHQTRKFPSKKSVIQSISKTWNCLFFVVCATKMKSYFLKIQCKIFFV